MTGVQTCALPIFFGMPQNVVEFSTYDMISNSYTQLNQIDFTSMSEHNYSFDFSDYHFDKPVKQKMTESVQNTEKRRRVIKQEYIYLLFY